jgi:hypothetical protein
MLINQSINQPPRQEKLQTTMCGREDNIKMDLRISKLWGWRLDSSGPEHAAAAGPFDDISETSGSINKNGKSIDDLSNSGQEGLSSSELVFC